MFILSKLRHKRKSVVGDRNCVETNGNGRRHSYKGRHSWLSWLKSIKRRKNGSLNCQNDEEAEENVIQQSENCAHQTGSQSSTHQQTSGTPPEYLTPVAVESPEIRPKILLDDELPRLFSGAPQFSTVDSDGQLQVSISFPWDFDLLVRDVNDSQPVPHAAYSGCTTSQHLPVAGLHDALDRRSIAFNATINELPSMLASTGTEPGTVGVEFFLQEPCADILNQRADEASPETMFNNFNNFELLASDPEKLGIRKFDFAMVTERLAHFSSVYSHANADEDAGVILQRIFEEQQHAPLFERFLVPSKPGSSTADLSGVKHQVECLIRVLNLKRVWFDFGNVEWRIRIGQLIFGETSADNIDSTVSEPEDGLSERNVMLLQLLLSCELYTRLETVASMSTHEVKNELQLTFQDVEKFFSMQEVKTKWDLVLARRFLNNVDARTFIRPKMVAQNKQTLTSRLLGMSPQESVIQVDELDVAFEPRRQDLQQNGLFFFANAIAWPNAGTLEQQLTEILHESQNVDGIASPSIYATPLSTPGTITPRSFRSNRESGYFGGAASPEMTPRSFQLQPSTPLSLSDSEPPLSQPPQAIGGWLTKSYLTGLIMPGEAICHLLMSALLENDAESIASLGEHANLYGGFVYKSRSFWSKSCILGRVLACHQDSKECMGWISSNVIPQGFGDGWLDVYSAPIELNALGESQSLEQRTHILSGAELSQVRSDDLTLPQDPRVHGSDRIVRLERLRLQDLSALSSNEHPDEMPETFSATLDFQTPTGSHCVSLTNLVQFVSAYPCTPPPISAARRLSQSASTEGDASSITRTRLAPAHPLHCAYRYRQVSISDLLRPAFELEADVITVVDARESQGSASELLVRAWCSSMGVNALIARVGTTCLSCAVREATGIEIKVVIRVGRV